MDKTYNQWDFYPIHLKPNEINDPTLVIKDFFADDSLAGHLERLKEWRYFVLKEDYYRDAKGSPAGLLYFYKLNIRLIEAVHLLKETKPYVKHLAPVNFFAVYNLPQYREQLMEWLEHGLSSNGAREFIETIDLITVYEHLEKLYATIWKIFCSAKEVSGSKAGSNPIQIYPNTQLHSNQLSLYQLNNVVSSISENLLAKITSKVKHKLPTVQAVIYLGTPPYSADKIYLLVFTSNDEQRLAQNLAGMLEESCREFAQIIALVHHASTLFNGIQNNNPFFNHALRCPAIYLSGDLLLPAPKTLNIDLSNEASSFKWQRWYGQGKDFLSGANYYIRNHAFGAALFSLHQCAECVLIAIIRGVLGYSINNHNLSRLFILTGMFTNELINVFDMKDEVVVGRFEQLKQAYINVSYKDAFEPDIKDVDTLYQDLNELVTQVEQVYQKHLLTNSL